MGEKPKDEIIAVVALKGKQEAVTGDVPVFVADSPDEQLAVSTTLSRTTKSMIHELPNGVHILIRH